MSVDLSFFDEVSSRSILQGLFVAIAVYYLFTKYFNPKKKVENVLPIDPKLLSDRLLSFKPQPLFEKLSKEEEELLKEQVIVSSKPSKTITVNNVKLLNFVSTDFLGLNESDSFSGGNEKTTEVSSIKAGKEALNKYGCGSCGPRGFYGTFDVHLKLEEGLKNFFNTDDCIVYSDSFITAPSVICAFTSKTDYLIVDESCNESIKSGCFLSKSNVFYYKHNNLKDLENILIKVNNVVNNDLTIRKMIITEAIFKNTGTLCEINSIINLRNKYKFRLFVDESHSIGILGENGRGIQEEFNIKKGEIDFIIGSLDNVFGSIGGFCVGDSVVVGHQRLMGAGYCFSASIPPFLSASALENLVELTQKGKKERIKILRNNIKCLHETIKQNKIKEYLTITSDILSPICYLSLSPKKGLSENIEETERYLKNTSSKMRKEYKIFMKNDKNKLKVVLTSKHTVNDINLLLNSLYVVLTK